MRIAHAHSQPDPAVLACSTSSRSSLVRRRRAGRRVRLHRPEPRLGVRAALSEGAIADQRRPPGRTRPRASRSRRTRRSSRRSCKAFPDEVQHVWSRIGTAEIATDPMGVELTDIFISLKPREQWTKADDPGGADRADPEGAPAASWGRGSPSRSRSSCASTR